MDALLKEWYGVLAFVLFDFAALILIISITYRWLFKRVLDFLVSIVCILFSSPLLLWLYVRARKAKKRGEIERILLAEPFIGKKGKKVFLRHFNGDLGRLKKCASLARLFDLFLGRISVIGYKPLTEETCETLTEVEFDRHITKPGLIHAYLVQGVSEEDMLKADQKYAWTFSFFMDTKIFFKWLLKKIRGQA